MGILNLKSWYKHRCRGVFFWALKRENLNKALLVRADLNDAKLLQMTNEMLLAVKTIEPATLKNNSYYEFEKSFIDPEEFDETIEYLRGREEFFQKVISKIKSGNDLRPVKSQLIFTYQFYKAGGIFQEFWFNRPYIYFSEEFYTAFLPEQNPFVKSHNFYLAGDIHFKRFEDEVRLLGDSVENLGYYMSVVPKEYAKKVLLNSTIRSSDRDFFGEASLFYDMMRKIADDELIVFMIELD